MLFSVFLNLIRWKNLLLIIYTQFILKFIFFEAFELVTILSIPQFLLFLTSITAITGSGYIINDVFDIVTDKINKPKKVVLDNFKTLQRAKKLYFYLNTIGLITGVLVCVQIQKPLASLFFIITPILLYLYSKYLKSTPLVGNFLVAFLIAILILLLSILDLNTVYKNENYYLVNSIIYIVSFFAFSLNFIREIVKDIEDVNGDYHLNMNTLPILIGRRRTKNIASILSVFTAIFLLFIILYLAPEHQIIAIYILILVFLPLLFIALKLTKTKSKKGFHKISTYLKICMFFGINTLIIIALYYK